MATMRVLPFTFTMVGVFVTGGVSECTDEVDFKDALNNPCTHYTNNPDNCKHGDAMKQGPSGSTACSACCVCEKCPESKTCGNIDAKNTTFSCAEDDTLLSEVTCIGVCDHKQCCAGKTCKSWDCPQDQLKYDEKACPEGGCTQSLCCGWAEEGTDANTAYQSFTEMTTIVAIIFAFLSSS